MCKGQESQEIDRIDAPQSTAPSSQWHAHGKGKMMVPLIRWNYTRQCPSNFSRKTKEWLKQHGWNL